jgi:hypothetical protein
VEGKRDNPAELIGILVGLDLAEPALRPEAPPGAAAQRFNRVVARRWGLSENPARVVGVATQRMGAAMHSSLLDLVILHRLMEGDTDADRLQHALGVPPDHTERFRSALDASMRVRLPILRAAGVF